MASTRAKRGKSSLMLESSSLCSPTAVDAGGSSLGGAAASRCRREDAMNDPMVASAGIGALRTSARLVVELRHTGNRRRDRVPAQRQRYSRRRLDYILQTRRSLSIGGPPEDFSGNPTTAACCALLPVTQYHETTRGRAAGLSRSESFRARQAWCPADRGWCRRSRDRR